MNQIGHRLLQWQQVIGAQEYMALERQDAIDRYLHSAAARALADKMAHDSAVRTEHHEPDPNDPWHGERHVFRYSVGVVDRTDAEAFAKQLDGARAEGLREAAKMAFAAAVRYHKLRSDGPCGYVIASALEDLSRALEVAAVEPK